MNEANPRTCTGCGAHVEYWCEDCTTDMEAEMARVDAMSPEERLKAWDAINPVLEVEFPLLHEYIEKLMGRPVWTHELGTQGMEGLRKELIRRFQIAES